MEDEKDAEFRNHREGTVSRLRPGELIRWVFAIGVVTAAVVAVLLANEVWEVRPGVLWHKDYGEYPAVVEMVRGKLKPGQVIHVPEPRQYDPKVDGPIVGLE